jgi:hypothetical protein
MTTKIEEALRPLTTEELADLELLSNEAIEEALARGRGVVTKHGNYSMWPFRPRF